MPVPVPVPVPDLAVPGELLFVVLSCARARARILRDWDSTATAAAAINAPVEPIGRGSPFGPACCLTRQHTTSAQMGGLLSPLSYIPALQLLRSQ